MNKSKQQRLKNAGWEVGTTQEFLGLSDEESALIEIKLALAAALKARRVRRQLTQTQLAQRIRSSQSRVAKMEAGDPSVSLDLLVRSLLALGTTPQRLARIIAKQTQSPAEVASSR